MLNQFNVLQNKINQSINFSFFPAIDGNSCPDYPLFSQYNDKKRVSRKGYSMTFSQLGCFASHYLLWEKCVELNKPIIILEDDALLLDDFANFIQVANDIKDIEFMWLTPHQKKNTKFKIKLKIANSIFKVSQFYKGWAYTTGYFISPKGAKKFLDYTQEWVYNVDISMDRYWENNIDYCGIYPAVVDVRPNNDSNIKMDNSKRRTIFSKTKRECYAIKDRINKFFFDIKH